MIVYHGTSNAHWNDSLNKGHLYVTTNIQHAEFHAQQKAIFSDSEPVLLQLDLDKFQSFFELLPDHDENGKDSYRTWAESLKDKSSFLLSGNTANLHYTKTSIASMRKDRLFKNKDGDIVELLDFSLSSKNGNSFLWLRCLNGNEISIQKGVFEQEFSMLFEEKCENCA